MKGKTKNTTLSEQFQNQISKLYNSNVDENMLQHLIDMKVNLQFALNRIGGV
jgi:hypothetical protein